MGGYIKYLLPQSIDRKLELLSAPLVLVLFFWIFFNEKLYISLNISDSVRNGAP